MFSCTLLYVHSSFANILMGKRELVALLSLSSWCLMIVVWLFLAVTWVCLQFVIVVFPDHTHLLFLYNDCSHIEDVHLLFCAHFINIFSFLRGIELRHFFPSTILRGCLVCVIRNSYSLHSFVFKLSIRIVHTLEMCTFFFLHI